MLTAAFYTLGCKLNQLETESIAAAFRAEGFAVVQLDEAGFSAMPSIILINTCTVTSHSEQKARRVIRKALRDYPGAVLVITGCYAELEAPAIEAMDELFPGGKRRLFTVPGHGKAGILDLPHFLTAGLTVRRGMEETDLRGLVGTWAGSGRQAGVSSPFRFRPADFSFHSRAFLKIQDGCDNHCAYCRVSIARGKSRSLGTGEIAAALRDLEEKGYNEAVLTGVNISQYAPDGEGRRPGLESLGVLLEYLLNGTKTIKLRLSSIKPEIFSPIFIKAVSHRRVQPHFHLSLQSGSDAVLSRMGRGYTSAEAREAAAQLRGAREDPFLACDIITGFPGETQEDFERTFELCETTDFAWIHAFPFSRRPGTAAWNFSNRVSEREACRRTTLLSALAQQGRRDYTGRWIGKTVEVITKSGDIKEPGFVSGVTENYLKVKIPLGVRPLPAAGELFRCKLTRSVAPPEESRFDAEAEIVEGFVLPPNQSILSHIYKRRK
jgi:threonylcarbamoyladenosine tRNA methylthiotransferase MtaB